ncbi:MAG: hypothetical protein NTX44_09920 [Ignavibacteriales bacterium]|nr:hypothetical protein [Ignavibacteriales bacterium]
MSINKCECGSKEFIVDEAIAHQAEMDDDGELTVYKSQECEVLKVVCAKCDKVYSEEDFKQINF